MRPPRPAWDVPTSPLSVRLGDQDLVRLRQGRRLGLNDLPVNGVIDREGWTLGDPGSSEGGGEGWTRCCASAFQEPSLLRLFRAIGPL
jgi:hypothetical protein